jgi:hypothetical protein
MKLESAVLNFPVPDGAESIRDPMFDWVRNPCNVIVELGTFAGWWAYRCLTQIPGAHLYCVDRFFRPGGWWSSKSKRRIDGEEIEREWSHRLKKFSDRVTLVRGDTHDVPFDREIDFLFIDAAHNTHECLLDLERWVPKVSSGGLIVGHDIALPKVKRAADRFFRDKGGYFTFPGHNDGISITPCFTRYKDW